MLLLVLVAWILIVYQAVGVILLWMNKLGSGRDFGINLYYVYTWPKILKRKEV